MFCFTKKNSISILECPAFDNFGYNFIFIYQLIAGKVGGQSGIISCLAPSPEGRVYAAGSYSRSSQYIYHLYCL